MIKSVALLRVRTLSSRILGKIVSSVIRYQCITILIIIIIIIKFAEKATCRIEAKTFLTTHVFLVASIWVVAF